jgi:hypothetical protein
MKLFGTPCLTHWHNFGKSGDVPLLALNSD